MDEDLKSLKRRRGLLLGVDLELPGLEQPKRKFKSGAVYGRGEVLARKIIEGAGGADWPLDLLASEENARAVAEALVGIRAVNLANVGDDYICQMVDEARRSFYGRVCKTHTLALVSGICAIGIHRLGEKIKREERAIKSDLGSSFELPEH